MRRILVTGAGGFIARHLVSHLAALGHEIVGVQRHHDAVGRPIEGITRLVTADLMDVEQIAKVIGETAPSIVVHLAAGQVGVETTGGRAPADADLAMTQRLLDAIDQSRCVRHILFASSSAVYDRSQPMPVAETAKIRPESAYGASKAAAEILIRGFAQGPRAATVLRLANVVGSGERRSSVVSDVARQIAEIEVGKRGVTVKHGRLDEARDLIDVRDTARAIASCCDSDAAGARTYNVGTGTAVPIADVVNALVGLAQIPVQLELDRALVRAGPASKIALDSTALHDALGWRPEVPLTRSLADGLDHWRDQLRITPEPRHQVHHDERVE